MSRISKERFGNVQADGGTVKLVKIKVMSEGSIARGRAMLQRLVKDNSGIKIISWRENYELSNDSK